MEYLATAWIRTSGPLSERQVRALNGTARELNKNAVVTAGEMSFGFRVAVTQAGGDPAKARAESYRITMYLVCHAGLDVVDARSEVQERGERA